MPNHCETDLTLAGPLDLLKTVVAAHFTENGVLNCDSLIPYPAIYKEADRIANEYEKAHPGDWTGCPKDGFNQGGYDWCCQNWGTKWGTYDGGGVKWGKRSVKMSFSSAWSPATPVFAKLAEMYPALRVTAKSYEGGMQVKYDYRWENGELISEEQDAYRGSRGG